MTARRQPWVLGISASHNGAACLLLGDRLVTAIQEERLSRIKRQRTYGARPSLAIQYCLDAARITPADLSMVVICAQGKARSAEHDLALNPQLRISQHQIPTAVISHHLGHAISAFALSGFKEAAILVIDGLGSPFEDLSEEEQRSALVRLETGWEHISLFHASGTNVHSVEKHLVPNGRWLIRRESGMPFFRTLGGMYSAVAEQIFGDPMEAGQVMGLAPYGEPDFATSDFFTFTDRGFRFNDRVPLRFSHHRRWPNLPCQYRNLACSVQKALEEAVLHLSHRLRRLSTTRNLCYAGGVALNCVTNELLIRKSGFDHFHIAPAAEDSGAAIGAAFYGLWQLTKRNTRASLATDSTGRAYSRSMIDAATKRTPGVEILQTRCNVLDETVARLCAGQFGAWFQGGSELGPRALGQRSILADPRREESKTLLNAKVKSRASFRPFAPAILVEHVEEWFDIGEVDRRSPFMLRTWQFKKERQAQVPAVVHVDGSGRVQTVDAESSPVFYTLLRRFHKKTNVPMLLNTSFNGRGEPIVETIEDALWCLLFTGLDFCVLHDRIVVREKRFRSIFNLHPQVTVNNYCVALPNSTNAFRAELSNETAVYCRAQTRWGEAEYALTALTVAILKLIDGRQNGWSLLRKLNTMISPELAEPLLIDSLASLRRMSLISFTA